MQIFANFRYILVATFRIHNLESIENVNDPLALLDSQICPQYLRDGMNLVAKEFVACQQDNDPGVLILSPFAGSGLIMQEALQVTIYYIG